MKFLCMECRSRMDFAERETPGDGTLSAVFECPECGRAVAMLTNPMETQLVSSLGVEIGGRTVPEEPMEMTREMVEGAEDEVLEGGAGGTDEDPASSDPGGQTPEKAAAGVEGRDGSAGEGHGGGPAAGDGEAQGAGGPIEPGEVEWTPAARDRLDRVPSFVRGMVHRIYTDYASDRGIRQITPEVMDRARSDLGLEGM